MVTHWDQRKAEMVLPPYQMAHSNPQALQGWGWGGQMSLAGGQRVGEPTNQESPVGECVSVDCPHCA